MARSSEAILRAGRRLLELAGDATRIESALESWLHGEVRIVVRKVDAQAARGPWVRVGVEVADSGARAVVGFEPALATALLAALLKRKVELVAPDAELDPALLGALTALVIETARVASAALPLRPANAVIPSLAAVVHLTVLLGDRPYAALLWVPSVVSAPPVAAETLMSRLSTLPLALPLVVGECALRAAELEELVVGSALCPGAGLWIDAVGAGRGVLVAGASERGAEVTLEPQGRIVLRQATTVALAAAETTTMPSDDASDPPTLADVVLDAPVLVRIELGQVSMAAREWAELKPGDVIGSGRRVAEPVRLRAAGRVLAEGELVNLEGELGVRVVRLLPDEPG